jgi:hypothetical protein
VDEDRPNEPAEADPSMKVVAIATLSEQEAILLAGRLNADGIRAVVQSGRSEPGRWTGWISGGLGVPINLRQAGTAEVLVDERDLEQARRIAERYMRR